MSRLSVSSLPPRSVDDRLVGGVCAGLAAVLGVDAALVRVAAVVLAIAGPGIPLYAVAWVLMPEATDGADAEVVAVGVPSRRAAGLALIVLGSILSLRSLGLTPPDEIVLPVLIIAAGVGAVIWRVRPLPVSSGRTAVRIGAGIMVVAFGLAAFFAGNFSFSVLRDGILATAFVVGGLALILGPWIAVLVRERAEERRQRIRAAEKAEVAAHLHDSVLQTFALIQRADDPRQMSALARRQERELRRWLYESESDPGAATVKAAFERVAESVEDRHGVTIETVVVGDRDLDPALEALVGAASEAMTNAAKWSGQAHISAFLEVGDTTVEAFVRDGGPGFDEASVDPDRMGIRESIHGRMSRVGGDSYIHSEPGEGVEVQLILPIR